MCRREFTGDLVHIAPDPSFAGHHRTHDWMPGLVEMLCSVLSWRRIAAADMAAGQTLAQRYPPSSLFETFLAGIWRPGRRKVSLSNIFEMFAWLFIHSFTLCSEYRSARITPLLVRWPGQPGGSHPT